MIRRPPRSTLSSSSAASDVYKRQLEKPKQNIMYSESELFGRNLKRYLRFHYMTDIMGDFSFEVDDQGTPYWIVSVHENKIGLFGGTDVKEVIMLNASTGEHKKMKVEEVPTWVDRVFESELVLEQINYNGKYLSLIHISEPTRLG